MFTVAVCCSATLCNTEVLQSVGALQSVAECCTVPQSVAVHCSALQCVAVRCSVLQCVAVRCSVLQCVAVCCSVLKPVVVCCSVLQCVAVCFSICTRAFVRERLYVDDGVAANIQLHPVAPSCTQLHPYIECNADMSRVSCSDI